MSSAILLCVWTSETATAPAAVPVETPVLIVGLSSTLYVTPSLAPLFSSDEDYVCGTFELRPKASPVPVVHVTSSGIGSASLALDLPVTVPCAQVARVEASFVTVSNLETARQIRIRLPTGLVPAPGNVVQGKIVAYAPGGKPVEMSLKLANASGNLALAVRWFLTIAIPTGLTGLVGYLLQKAMARSSARRKEVDDFADYVAASIPTLEDFFTNFYPTLYHSQDDFAGRLFKELNLKAVYLRLPRAKRDALDAALQTEERKPIQEALCAAFPRWRSSIMNPEAPHE